MKQVENQLDEHTEASPDGLHPRRSGKRLLWFLVVPFALGASALLGTQARQKESQQLAAITQSLELQPVHVIHPERGESSSDLTLPGMIQAFSQ